MHTEIHSYIQYHKYNYKIKITAFTEISTYSAFLTLHASVLILTGDIHSLQKSKNIIAHKVNQISI